MKRKSIVVNESCFNEFDERRKALGLNSTETLQALLQTEITRTETTMVNRVEGFDRSNTFSNAENQLRKEGET